MYASWKTAYERKWVLLATGAKQVDYGAYRNEILCGDCVEVMKQIPDEYVAGCITDPPYNYEFIGHNWNTEEIKRRTERIKDSSTLVKNIPYGSGLAGGVRNKRWYDRNYENIIDYQNWVFSWGQELYRITKPGSFVFVFNSTRTVAHVQVALEKNGFYARDIIVWRRNSGIPKGLNISKKLEKMGEECSESWNGWHSCLRNEWEAIVVLQKPLKNNYLTTFMEYGVGLLKAENGNGFQSNILENIKRDSLEDYNIHVTVKPIELIEKLIELSIPEIDSNIVIDPFLGSGTTAIAAQNKGVGYIGIDINPEYIEIAKKRLSESYMLIPPLFIKQQADFSHKG